MKQIIKNYNNGDISCKYYLNHLNQKNGMLIWYFTNGSIFWKCNYINDKLFALYSDYDISGYSKIEKITYHL